MKNRVLAASLGVLLSLSLAGCDRGEIEDIQTEDFYAANPDKAKSVSEACALADLSKESAEIYDNCERAAMAYFKIFYKSMMQSVSRQEVKAQDEKQKAMCERKEVRNTEFDVECFLFLAVTGLPINSTAPKNRLTYLLEECRNDTISPKCRLLRKEVKFLKEDLRMSKEEVYEALSKKLQIVIKDYIDFYVSQGRFDENPNKITSMTVEQIAPNSISIGTTSYVSCFTITTINTGKNASLEIRKGASQNDEFCMETYKLPKVAKILNENGGVIRLR